MFSVYLCVSLNTYILYKIEDIFIYNEFVYCINEINKNLQMLLHYHG